MLKNIPAILSPELLSVLCEMGHGDTIVLGDGNFPGRTMAAANGARLIRADGHGVPALLDAILTLIPLDAYVDTPVMLMNTDVKDKGMVIPIFDEYRQIIMRHDPRGNAAIGFYERFEFYEHAKCTCCVVQTGETAIYANVILQKGVII
ncbi:MAG: RbsD/FucU domain-containing protein [Clostridia bacterium]